MAIVRDGSSVLIVSCHLIPNFLSTTRLEFMVARGFGTKRHGRSLIGVLMIDDQDLGFFANFLGIFIFVLVIAYHYVMADLKYEGN
ncbi:hypothetical protein CsSME_00028544 [Camellia sinensis var. sinensis]